MIKHFLNPPNWFTSASIFCSVYAMALVIAEPPDAATLSRACVLVIFGGIFDLLDGRVARMTNRFTEFGVQLDSIADVLGFGLAPALIAWAWVLKDMGAVGVGVAFWYVLSAAFRLARFNVDTKDHTWALDGHTQGLTTTMAGGTLVTFVWVANGYLANVLNPSASVVAVLVGSLGMLMISSIPFRSFKDLRKNRRARLMLAVFLASCLAGAVVLDPSMWWGVGGALYLSLGLIDGLVTAVWHRRLTTALLIDELEEALAEEPVDYEAEELEA
ncbi:MAG: CDP-alcohol phosphatidyltransferase family protein [Alphaproteobacteria bacterium]|nr:CDP-alcohol phosphatidyltransferase family protein [Alphaproteobacteria bacterium]MCB9697403.1 CDP-alcohol phosphatidyltransferase family protein [Alphaproteobacteria bacterium]